MARLFHYLGTCSTCQRIMKESPGLDRFTLREIKGEPLTSKELDALKALAGSYEALFSRRAMKFRQMGLHERQLTEKDYRDLILQEYTFLKRPVMVADGRIFIGSSRKVVEEMVAAGA